MNKAFFILLYLTFISFISLPQTKGKLFLNADTLNNSEDKQITIRNDWKFKPGDNLDRAKKEYNDSNWENVSSYFILDSIKTEQQTGKAWFRLTIKVDSSLYNEILSLGIYQRGASQIYFDGKFIKEFGNYGNTEEENAYNPQNIPIAIQLDSSDTHVLAIRYSYFDALSKYKIVGRMASFAGFRVKAGILNESIFPLFVNVRANIALNLSLFGILISLGLLHLLIYLYYKSEKENLYYFIFTFNMAALFLLGYIANFGNNPESLPFLFIFQNIFSLGLLIFLLILLYSISYSKIPKFFWIILTIAVGILLFIFFAPSLEIINILIGIYVAIAVIESFRVIVKAIRKKISGSWIIGTGAIVFLLFVSFVFGINIFEVEDTGLSDTLMILILYTGFVSIPVSMSVYLARSFAKTNKDLSNRLIEVKELSEKAIEQERSNAELKIQSEREKAKAKEAELQAKALQIENERKAKELEEARKLQLSMLPKDIPSVPGIDIAVYMQTATEVGGDYYDFYISPENELTTVVGDATGHGVKAGVLVTTIKSLFIQNAENKIIDMFHHFSKSIKQMKFENLYMCLLICKIKDKKMKISSAGIPPVYIYRKANKNIEMVIQKGMPLGSFLNFPYKEKEIDLNSGDTVLIMSDGFPEMHNDKKEMFGYKRVENTFKEVARQSPENIISFLSGKVKEWKNDKSPDDDVTFVVIKVK